MMFIRTMKEYCDAYVLPLGICAEGPFVYCGVIYRALYSHGNTVLIDRREDTPIIEIPSNLEETVPLARVNL